jgi:Mrp family chromosome partitioning ATPase
MMTTLRQTFLYVVIDSPPLIPFSDGLSLAQLSDAVILVSRYGFTTRRAIRRCAELLAEVQAPLVGVVLNRVDFASADYHYFNYGYSRELRGRRYEYGNKKQASASEQLNRNEQGPEKSRGAHA